MQSLDVSKLYVANDGSAVRRAASLEEVAADAGVGLGITVGSPTASGADARVLRRRHGRARPPRTLFNSTLVRPAPSVEAVRALGAVRRSAFAAALWRRGAATLYVSSPGFCPRTCPRAGSQFVQPFSDRLPPTPAAAGDLRLRGDVGAAGGAQAGRRLRRTTAATVVKRLLRACRTASRCSAPTRSTPGDTSIAPFVFAASVGGKLVPFRSVQVAGLTALRRSGGGELTALRWRRSLAALLARAAASQARRAANQIPGETLTVYASVPLHGASSGQRPRPSLNGAAAGAGRRRTTGSAATGSCFTSLDDATAQARDVGSGADDANAHAGDQRPHRRSATSATSTPAPARSRSRCSTAPGSRRSAPPAPPSG